MEFNRKLALFVSYYLARFNVLAYSNLGFGNQYQTHKAIGEILSVKASTVKNWRDEFDPLFKHRAGWYQRPLSPSRVQVVNALSNLSEREVFLIVNKILKEPNGENIDIKSLTDIVGDSKETSEKRFILRTPTGKKAESYFIDYFNLNHKPVDGKLKDTRDLGCGYDFEILDGENKCYVEVKGLSELSGGILLTNKEWETAKIAGNNYYIAIVSNLNEKPQIKFIKNPFSKLAPTDNIITTLQINWSVTEKQLKEVYD